MAVTHAIVPARFVDRPNRFVLVAELEDGRQVAAHLPNTGRLEHLMVPGRRLILRRDGASPRTTQYTTIRAWDGCWVGLEARRAPQLLADWLLAGNPFPGFGQVAEVRAEMTVEGHRLDLLAATARGPVWIEVKSGSRAIGGEALLSKTPSTRGVAHLGALAGLIAEGRAAAAVFVFQRPDARVLRIGGDADLQWVEAARAAHAAGVPIIAFGCEVSEEAVSVGRQLPVAWER